MITVTDIEKLANLARIKLDETEKLDLTKDIDAILVYVDQIKKATVNNDQVPDAGINRNVFREDVSESNPDRELILNEAPDREGDFIAVKKIIAQD